MSDKFGRMEDEKEINKIDNIDDQTEMEDELAEILKIDKSTGRKKADLSFLEDENIYFSDEEEETTSENGEIRMADTKKRKKNFWNKLTKSQRTALTILIVFLSVLLIVGAIGGIYLSVKLAKINYGNELNKDITEYQDPDYGEILFDAGSDNFRQALKDWATTGNENIMDSKNVINVLLIGADSRNGTNSGNTDVMMIVSLNKKTKEIKLVSLLRDSYLYIDGVNRQSCTKLNSAFSMGGAECLMETIENNYKIDIDNYVMVNFESFERIIDAMGGINLDITQEESNYCARRFGVSLPVGDDVKLNGEQALCFCRIRAIYSTADVKRTENQREVIEAIIDKVLTASLSDLDEYIDILFPEIYTGYSQGEILSLGVEALSYGWAKYPRKQCEAPDSASRQSGDAGGMWIWVVDLQKAAHTLQIELYGESNITLDEDRTSLIDIYNSGSSQSGGNSGSTAQEPVTQQDVTEPEETTATTEIQEENPGTGDVTEEGSEPVTGETVPQTSVDPTEGTEPNEGTGEIIEPETEADPGENNNGGDIQ